MPLGVLSQARVSAEASLPLGWRLIGVWRYPEAPDKWVVVASGPNQPADTATGAGNLPQKALNRLADALRELRGSASGDR